MKYTGLTLLLFSSIASALDLPGDFSGVIELQHRYFSEQGLYGNTDKHHSSIMLQPEYFHSWDNDRSVMSIIPFVRFDHIDDERSHYDLREFSFVSSLSYLELRLGISKVFWGTTESRHLVDVINHLTKVVRMFLGHSIDFISSILFSHFLIRCTSFKQQ